MHPFSTPWKGELGTNGLKYSVNFAELRFWWAQNKTDDNNAVAQFICRHYVLTLFIYWVIPISKMEISYFDIFYT